MRRVACLAAVTVIGVTLAAASNQAQAERHPIRPLELAENLYVLTSDPAEQGMRTGGNTAVFLTTDGVVLVDTKIKGYGQDILASVREITDLPVTTIINTHTHWDHSGSNPEFPDTINIVTHENTAAHMASADCDDGAGFEGGSIKNCEQFQGGNARFLPDTTYSTRHTLFGGADQIDLYYFGRGHTDGDTFVVFKDARTVHTGDMMARKGLPFIDAANSNGSATEFGATLQGAADGIPDVDTVITGHADDSARLAGPRGLRRLLQRHGVAGACGTGGRPQRRRDRRGLHAARPLQRLRRPRRPPPADRAPPPRGPLAGQRDQARRKSFGAISLRSPPGPMYEVACHDGNYAIVNILSGLRAQDGTPKEPSAEFGVYRPSACCSRARAPPRMLTIE